MISPIMVLLIGHVVCGQRTSDSDNTRMIGPNYLLTALIQKLSQQQQATNYLVRQILSSSQQLAVEQSAAEQKVQLLSKQHPGWILVQQHYNGSTSFNRGWNDYKNGFGDIRGDHWIGNDWLHMLTSSGRYKARFDVQAKFNSQWYWAEYTTFSVGDESTNYRLTVSGYSGTAGDTGSSFSYHDGYGFATFDRNNLDGCATGRSGNSGGFWYGGCAHANINGSPLLYSSNGVEGFLWNELPVGSSRADRRLMTSRMWLVPL